MGGSVFGSLSWVGAGYNPHVTTVEERSFPPGSKYRAAEIALIMRDKTKNKIVRYSVPL